MVKQLRMPRYEKDLFCSYFLSSSNHTKYKGLKTDLVGTTRLRR